VAEDLVAAVGEPYVSRHESVLSAYARDAYPLALRAAGGHPGLEVRPDIVVRPATTAEVVKVVTTARRWRVPVVPYGGGSGICGGALATSGGVVLDLKRLDAVVEMDEESMVVTVGAGILGGELERRLGMHGLTCGHYPQSIYSSTVGGWISHRGVGTFSTRYGKMDDLLVSLEVVLPSGDVLRTRAVPTSAAGPDLNRLFLGAEGTLGVITEATIKMFVRPTYRRHATYRLDDMAAGLSSIRQVLQAGYRPAVVRLYDSVETETLFGQVPGAEGATTLLVLDEGPADLVDASLMAMNRAVTANGGKSLASDVGEHWLENRYSTVSLCETLAKAGGVADAIEVANNYRMLPRTYDAMKASMEAVSDRVKVYGHASHFYHSGGNLYMIFHAEVNDPADAPGLYHRVLDAALSACHAQQGTLTHHHGVGIAKARHMPTEWGQAGIRLWRSVKGAVDPSNTMNPGDKLLLADG
jgi:alkyldihydroxyacetonephosphate synthase